MVLDPYMAMDYLAAPSVLLHGKIVWDEEAMELQKGAALLKEALRLGWYSPSYEQWQAGRNGWKLQLPMGESARLEELITDRFPASFWEEWFSSGVENLLATDPSSEFSRAWNQLRQEYGLLRVDEPGFEIDENAVILDARE